MQTISPTLTVNGYHGEQTPDVQSDPKVQDVKLTKWFNLAVRTRLTIPSFTAGLLLLVSGCGGDSNDKSTSRTKTESRSVADIKSTPKTRAPGNSRHHGKTPSRVTPQSKSTVVAKPPVVKPKPKPEPVYRPPDNRPKHDDARLAKLGIRRYDSKRLRLYTDLDPKIAAGLPRLIDESYKSWIAYFGNLPPTRAGDPFQVTGYLIVDKALFKRAGLVPVDLPRFINGRHRGYEFWMYDTPWTYYRRHLLIHEATHCFMYAVRDTRFPPWYMEGMAEYFGTHAIDKNGDVKNGVMPQRFDDFVGFGRIEYVQQDCESGKPLLLLDVVNLKAIEFLHNQAYAWSWALCKFLDSHPRYRKRFRKLGQIQTSREFMRAFGELVKNSSPQIFAEWHLFSTGLVYGYETDQAAIEIRPGKPIPLNNLPIKVTLKTDRGWQSSGVSLARGDEVEITATGRFHLAQKPKPWISEPQGISFTYFLGRPLGEVVAVVVPDSERGNTKAVRALTVVPIGRESTFRAEIAGTVYLRINDSFAKLSDNTGSLEIKIRRPIKKP